jgi:hypothetical protein
MTIIIDGSTGISSIGTLTGVTSISSAAANTPVIMQDSGSNSNTVRAWVNFNGTGTVAIRVSFNVSSITDNGTGDYTVNFTNALPDANYSIVGSVINGENKDAVIVAGVAGIPNPTPPTTSLSRFQVRYAPSNSLQDSNYVNIAVFR